MRRDSGATLFVSSAATPGDWTKPLAVDTTDVSTARLRPARRLP